MATTGPTREEQLLSVIRLLLFECREHDFEYHHLTKETTKQTAWDALGEVYPSKW